MVLQPEKIDDLSPEHYIGIMKRSSTDIGSIYEKVRNILSDVRGNGQRVFLDYYRKELKPDLTATDLEAGEEETKAAYSKVDPAVIDALKSAAENITTFHRAQKGREMWSIDIADGIQAGRITRPLERHPWRQGRLSQFRVDDYPARQGGRRTGYYCLHPAG